MPIMNEILANSTKTFVLSPPYTIFGEIINKQPMGNISELIYIYLKTLITSFCALGTTVLRALSQVRITDLKVGMLHDGVREITSMSASTSSTLGGWIGQPWT